jgi:hypothetical protein
MRPAIMKRGDRVVEKKWKQKNKNMEKQRLSNVRSVVDINAPKAHLIQKS